MNKLKILAVDDEPKNLQLLRQIFKDEYQLVFAKSGDDALKNAVQHMPDLILLDVMMPIMDGYEVCRRLKTDRRVSQIPVIFVTAMSEESDEARGFELGAVDYVTKPIRPAVVRMRIKTHLELANQRRSCLETVTHKNQELRETRLRSLLMLGKAAEFKDNETGMHVQRMSRYSELLARSYGWNDDACEMILNAAPMHDIGKIGVPDHILQKPGALDEPEWEVMRRHPGIGADIIGGYADGSGLFEMAASIALTHHEKWNGSGYPNGLSGEDIPTEGRIVAVADVFDALTTRRPYKDPWPVEKAVRFLQDEAGQHFDPELVSLFIKKMPEVLVIRERWQETDIKAEAVNL